MGYGCKPLEGQNNSHKAHMPGFILPQVFRVICCPAPTLLFVWVVYGLYVWGVCVCTLRLVLTDVYDVRTPSTQLFGHRLKTGTERRFSTLSG